MKRSLFSFGIQANGQLEPKFYFWTACALCSWLVTALSKSLLSLQTPWLFLGIGCSSKSIPVTPAASPAGLWEPEYIFWVAILDV